jgi:hypothetical protein
MKNVIYHLMVLFSIGFLTSCTPLVHHADKFYDYNDSDYPRDHLPLINPVEATRERSSSPWNLKLISDISIDLPNSKEVYGILFVYTYDHVKELNKFAIENGVIMAYSSYVDKDADPYILNNYYHWFVLVLSDNSTKGFHTEDEFLRYIQTLGIQDPDWKTPDESFNKFMETRGCLEWIPDCSKPTQEK